MKQVLVPCPWQMPDRKQIALSVSSALSSLIACGNQGVFGKVKQGLNITSQEAQNTVGPGLVKPLLTVDNSCVLSKRLF